MLTPCSPPCSHVRRTLPPPTLAVAVDILGSWDNFRTPVPLEQDRRVGADVWKGILSANGGLEMGSEHHYYVCRPPSRLAPPFALTM